MRSRTQALIAFFSAMTVTLVAVSDMGRSSPGALSAVHQREPDLAGRNDCSACHGGVFGTLREACLECHEAIATQLAESRGLHGTLEARAEQCGLCHAEHHGAGAPLVHGQSFALAGIGRIADFDHRLVGFVLDGAHAKLRCSECHEHADASLLPPGAQRFLGLERDCAACHEDAHEGRMVLDCTACHGQETWDGLASAGHERFVALVGGHGDMACAKCHAEDGPYALDTLGLSGPHRPDSRDCAACHESPHAEPFTAGASLLAALTPGAACVTCHAAEHTTFDDPALLGMSAELHAGSGFPLEPPHDEPACVDCHAPESGTFEQRYPGRGAGECSACHEDVHEGQFEAGPFGGQECNACHESTRFEPHAFTAEMHARTELELTGSHLALACQDCHTDPPPREPRQFHGTASDCDACHADAHDGFFADFTAALAEVEHGECARCHGTGEFADGAQDFEHEAFTGFAVRGAHDEGGCALCHEAAAEPDEAGRTFGRVTELFGAFEGCATCHADPHGGRFDAEDLSSEVGGRSDCARCHVETSFRMLPHGFDHGTWTGFPLFGAHDTACAACHEPLIDAAPGGRTTSAAAGADCADCHQDPHAGQFADVEGQTECARCHSPERTNFLSFDHERDARFALGEAHRELECAACHQPSLRKGVSVVTYRPLGRECADCHGDNAEVRLRRQPRR